MSTLCMRCGGDNGQHGPEPIHMEDRFPSLEPPAGLCFVQTESGERAHLAPVVDPESDYEPVALCGQGYDYGADRVALFMLCRRCAPHHPPFARELAELLARIAAEEQGAAS